jgi:hypothetical protein
LSGSSLSLLVTHEIDVTDDKCHTASYSYRLASGRQKEDWLLRWEYYRRRPKPDYSYPLAHVHVNGQLDAADRVALPRLHLPTERVPLELVVWHAIAEWGVTPKSDDWQQVLEGSIERFREARSAAGGRTNWRTRSKRSGSLRGVAERTPEDEWRDVERLATQFGLTVKTEGPKGRLVPNDVWLAKLDGDAASKCPKDWYGPYPNMGDEIEAAIPKVSGRLWRETHPEDRESESEPES